MIFPFSICKDVDAFEENGPRSFMKCLLVWVSGMVQFSLEDGLSDSTSTLSFASGDTRCGRSLRMATFNWLSCSSTAPLYNCFCFYRSFNIQIDYTVRNSILFPFHSMFTHGQYLLLGFNLIDRVIITFKQKISFLLTLFMESIRKIS